MDSSCKDTSEAHFQENSQVDKINAVRIYTDVSISLLGQSCLVFVLSVYGGMLPGHIMLGLQFCVLIKSLHWFQIDFEVFLWFKVLILTPKGLDVLAASYSQVPLLNRIEHIFYVRNYEFALSLEGRDPKTMFLPTFYDKVALNLDGILKAD